MRGECLLLLSPIGAGMRPQHPRTKCNRCRHLPEPHTPTPQCTKVGPNCFQPGREPARRAQTECMRAGKDLRAQRALFHQRAGGAGAARVVHDSFGRRHVVGTPSCRCQSRLQGRGARDTRERLHVPACVCTCSTRMHLHRKSGWAACASEMGSAVTCVRAPTPKSTLTCSCPHRW